MFLLPFTNQSKKLTNHFLQKYDSPLILFVTNVTKGREIIKPHL